MDVAWIFPDWPAPPRVRTAVTTREGPGVSVPPFGRFNLGRRNGDRPEAVQTNRSVLRQTLNLPAEPRWLRQVHGTTVAELGPLASEDEPEADAAISRLPGTVLGVLTADCLPVFFCADDGSAIGVAHAGWRGLAAGVLEAVVEQLQLPPSCLLTWLGPAAGAASYEVGDEVREAFVRHDRAAVACFTATRAGHWRCDIEGLARQRLTAGGVTRIHGGGFDTLTDPRFYSHRREGARRGSFASLIWLAED